MNAIFVEKPFKGQWNWIEDVCQTCHTCVEICPANALFNKKAKFGERVEKITHRPEACIYCGACAIACPVNAITVRKTAILPSLEKCIETDEDACLGCGNCVIVCPVNALNNRELAAGYLNNMDEKALLEVKNGKIFVVNQDLCGEDGICVLICPVNAIWFVKREAN